MRPLVWWVQDHLGLTAAGLLGIAAVVVAIVIVSSGGSADAPQSASKVAANGSAETSNEESSAPVKAEPEHKHRRHAAVAHHGHRSHPQKAEQPDTGGVEKPSSKSQSHAGTATRRPGARPKSQQPSEAASHSLGQATAEKVAAAHPGTSCPKSYSKKQCEEAVRAAADPAASIPVTQPSDCTKAMSAAQCEELFAAEEAARAAGGGSISAQECMEHPELEECAAVVEEMKAQYEAAHPGG